MVTDIDYIHIQNKSDKFKKKYNNNLGTMALVPPPTQLEILKVMVLFIMATLGFGPGVNAPEMRECTSFRQMAWKHKIQTARDAASLSRVHPINT